MSGVAINLGNFVGCCVLLKHVWCCAPVDGRKLEKCEPSILASLSDKHRMTKAGISFGILPMVEGNQFYMEDVDEVLSFPIENFNASEARCRVGVRHQHRRLRLRQDKSVNV